ncbi:MAG TPA: GDSL-type esterase/lipase family protein [Desulfosporosinus sp.]|nr:GDSL-type esterase/lipase family protein [Desulfosporosinus sp.]
MRTYRLEIRLIQAAIGLAFIVLIAGFFGLWGQNGQVPEETTGPVVTTPAPPVSNTKIVALGDSFTLGYPLDAAHSWTQRMADVLKVEVINKGKVNQTSKDLLARFDADVVAEKPAQVIIFAGMGDGIEGVNRDEVQTNIKAMVEKAKANEIIPILALPIPYPGAQQNIQDIRETELSYAKKENIKILDFTSVLFDANNKYLSGLSSTDGQYPNDKGYATMGDYAAETLK